MSLKLRVHAVQRVLHHVVPAFANGAIRFAQQTGIRPLAAFGL